MLIPRVPEMEHHRGIMNLLLVRGLKRRVSNEKKAKKLSLSPWINAVDHHL